MRAIAIIWIIVADYVNNKNDFDNMLSFSFTTHTANRVNAGKSHC